MYSSYSALDRPSISRHNYRSNPCIFLHKNKLTTNLRSRKYTPNMTVALLVNANRYILNVKMWTFLLLVHQLVCRNTILSNESHRFQQGKIYRKSTHDKLPLRNARGICLPFLALHLYLEISQKGWTENRVHVIREHETSPGGYLYLRMINLQLKSFNFTLM